MPHVFCLDCDRKIILHSDVRVGDQVTCSSCDAEFQLISIDPLEIEWLYGDFDDDDDDSSDDEEEDDWSHLVAKQRRHQVQPDLSLRRNNRDSAYD